jgi:hypothetical protein
LRNCGRTIEMIRENFHSLTSLRKAAAVLRLRRDMVVLEAFGAWTVCDETVQVAG